jgi:hypothetical protein
MKMLRLLWVRVTQLALLSCLLWMCFVATNWLKQDLFLQPISDFSFLTPIFVVFIIRGLGLIFVLQRSEKTPANKRGVVFESVLLVALALLAWQAL